MIKSVDSPVINNIFVKELPSKSYASVLVTLKKHEGKWWVYDGYTMGIRGYTVVWVGIRWVYGVSGGYTMGIRCIWWVYDGYTMGIRWGMCWVYDGYTIGIRQYTVMTAITYIQRLSPSNIIMTHCLQRS